MIQIDLLKNHPSCIPMLARIWYEVLGQVWVPDVSVTQVEQNFQRHLNSDTLPLTFVAFADQKPVGMCSLRGNDGIRPDLKPWLGSLVVDPEYQGKGIAKMLINSTRQKAVKMGFETLYLFAFDVTIPDYYQSLGWQKTGMDECRSHPVTVMKIDLLNQ